MTAGEMLGFINRLNEIRQSSAPSFIKNERLMNLLRDISDAYHFDGHATALYFTVASEL